jgi:RNA polymerase primary sigma factor
MKHYEIEKLLTTEEEKELFSQVKKKKQRQAAIDRITKANIGMVIKIAQRHEIPGIELEDLVQEGTLGLLKAIDEFDLARGTRFITFAYAWIKAFIIQYIQNSGLIRIPRQTQYIKTVIDKLAQKLERKPTAKEVIKKLKTLKSRLAAENFIQDLIDIDNQDFASSNYLQFSYDSVDWQLDRIPDELCRIEEVEAKMDIRKLLPMIPERNQKIIKLYYGIDCEKPLTLVEIGKKVKLSREGVRRAVAQSVKVMQEYVRQTDNKLVLGVR